MHPYSSLGHLHLGSVLLSNVDTVGDDIGFFIFALFCFSVFTFCWLILLDCQLHIDGKRNSQLKNCLDQIGLWACLLIEVGGPI